MNKWKRMNNDGFSIVEAMVAIVILSIIFIPITNSFISSIKASRETKIMQEATSTAQLAMEEVKKKSFQELANDYTITSGDVNTDTWTELKMNKEITKAENGCCDFEVNVEVSKSSTQTDTSGINTINSVPMQKIYSMESAASKKITVPATQDWIITYLAGKSGASANTVKNNVYRKIYITAEKDTATGNTHVFGKIDYYYSIYFVQGDTFDETLSSTLKNLYLYYTADYTGQQDTLTLQNGDQLEGNLYIIGEGADSTIHNFLMRLVGGTNIDKFKIITTVPVIGATKTYSVSTDAAYVPDRETDTRRYEIVVSVKKKGSNEVYSNMVSTRGE